MGLLQENSVKYTNMRPGDMLKIVWILIKVPFSLALLFVMNMVNCVAPDFTFKFMQKRMKTKGISKPFQSTSDFGFVFSMDLVKLTTNCQIQDILKEAQVGSAAPNPSLIDLPTKTSITLLSLAKAGSPLVVNFGSCT